MSCTSLVKRNPVFFWYDLDEQVALGTFVDTHRVVGRDIIDPIFDYC